jgi:hypothetical protein
MYPRIDVELHPELPDAAEFWIPSSDDIDEEEGFGYFREVWPILNVSVRHARKVVSQDRSLCTLVASLAANELEFDALGAAAETGSADDIDEITSDQLTALVDHFQDAEELEGLEIGVAGLVYALAAAGMYPAASCRGHADSNAWSASPVVFFAADRPHAEVLQPLVREAECGFEIDPARPEMLVIASASVQETLALAKKILSAISNFTELDTPSSPDS